MKVKGPGRGFGANFGVGSVAGSSRRAAEGSCGVDFCWATRRRAGCGCFRVREVGAGARGVVVVDALARR
jgi:hypothetical protein